MSVPCLCPTPPGGSCPCVRTAPGRGAGRAAAPRRTVRGLILLGLAVLLGVIAGAPAQAQSVVPSGVPSSSEAVRLRAALDAVERRDYNTAMATAGGLRDPLARTVVQWARFKAGLGTFTGISRFMKSHSDWPHQRSLRRAAERALTGREDPRRLLDWFESHPPLTTDGMVARARALLTVGRQDEARRAARTAWVDGRFSESKQKSFFNQFRSFLRVEDHERRLSSLIWDERLTEAQRMYPLVSAGHRALAEARILLIRNNPGVDGAIERVPGALRDDPGLVFDRLVWRRKRDLLDRATELLFHPAANQGDPDAWARQRAILAREALDRRQSGLAYRIAAGHGHTGGIAFATGEWTAGWVALRFLNQPAKALPHFEAMHAGVSYPQSLSRAAYWAGRAAQALGRRDQATTWYRRAAQHAETFYGQLAIEAMGESLARHMDARPPVTDADRRRFAADQRVRVIALMDGAGRADMALPFVAALNDSRATPGFRVLVADFLAGTSRPDLAVVFARRAALSGTMLPRAGYPAPDALVRALSQAPRVGPRPEVAVLLALIRQESNFNAQAVSRVGARGLMQLMPRTAQGVAAKLGEPYSLAALTEVPTMNVRFGTAYFAGLLDDFNGSYVLSIAGYNAGPHRSRQWRSRHGDPRRMSTEDVIDWIERIPFPETRNYVQRVLEGTQVYRHRLGQGATGSLSADLRR
ncbi:lytic transglycosylase domain-containing protein [Roseospira visakhapatnamensis]|uniref:Soluble lytic murein transglycosylase n=1 Tax=Roseospira visakhapatnamensis TaxID=390880 RepID=A0A7W6RD17_9PROT|nr:lytic transglycosylase domain-containing protein [Roseospira visakhapatnamensis]MBB4265784.1 soluble lytic murein transglycosylase [Roseospira visakhapatnamensis]